MSNSIHQCWVLLNKVVNECKGTDKIDLIPTFDIYDCVSELVLKVQKLQKENKNLNNELQKDKNTVKLDFTGIHRWHLLNELTDKLNIKLKPSYSLDSAIDEFISKIKGFQNVIESHKSYINALQETIQNIIKGEKIESEWNMTLDEIITRRLGHTNFVLIHSFVIEEK